MLLLAPCLAAAPLVTTARDARIVAAGTTAAGYGLATLGAAGSSTSLFLVGATGILVGPSTGHLAAGDTWRGLATIGGRGLALAGLGASGILWAHNCILTRGDPPAPAGWWDRGPCRESWGQLGLGYGSIAAFAGLTAWDLLDAGRAPARVAARAPALGFTWMSDPARGMPGVQLASAW